MPKKTTDLQKFESLFGVTARQTKNTDRVLEFRVQNLDGMMQAAKEIITKNKLNLVAETSGSLAQIRAFEVKYKS